jgi:hypothetical protein
VKSKAVGRLGPPRDDVRQSIGGTQIEDCDCAALLAASPARALTRDQLWAGFDSADALMRPEQVKPGFSNAYKAAVLGGECCGLQILDFMFA